MYTTERLTARGTRLFNFLDIDWHLTQFQARVRSYLKARKFATSFDKVMATDLVVAMCSLSKKTQVQLLPTQQRRSEDYGKVFASES